MSVVTSNFSNTCHTTVLILDIAVDSMSKCTVSPIVFLWDPENRLHDASDGSCNHAIIKNRGKWGHWEGIVGPPSVDYGYSCMANVWDIYIYRLYSVAISTKLSAVLQCFCRVHSSMLCMLQLSVTNICIPPITNLLLFNIYGTK